MSDLSANKTSLQSQSFLGPLTFWLPTLLLLWFVLPRPTREAESLQLPMMGAPLLAMAVYFLLWLATGLAPLWRRLAVIVVPWLPVGLVVFGTAIFRCLFYSVPGVANESSAVVAFFPLICLCVIGPWFVLRYVAGVRTRFWAVRLPIGVDALRLQTSIGVLTFISIITAWTFLLFEIAHWTWSMISLIPIVGLSIFAIFLPPTILALRWRKPHLAVWLLAAINLVGYWSAVWTRKKFESIDLALWEFDAWMSTLAVASLWHFFLLRWTRIPDSIRFPLTGRLDLCDQESPPTIGRPMAWYQLRLRTIFTWVVIVSVVAGWVVRDVTKWWNEEVFFETLESSHLGSAHVSGINSEVTIRIDPDEKPSINLSAARNLIDRAIQFPEIEIFVHKNFPLDGGLLKKLTIHRRLTHVELAGTDELAMIEYQLPENESRTRVDAFDLAKLLELPRLNLARVTNVEIVPVSGLTVSLGRQLRELDLNGSNVDDSFFAPIESTHRLTKLNLSKTRINGQMFDPRRPLRNLRVANFAGSKMDDQGVIGIFEIPLLSNYDLKNTCVTGESFDRHPTNKSDRRLSVDVQGCPISKIGLQRIARLPGLSTLSLDVDGAKFRSEDLVELKEAKALSHLQLDIANLDSGAIETLCSINTLASLDIKTGQMDAAAIRKFFPRNRELQLSISVPLRYKDELLDLMMEFPTIDFSSR